MLSAPASGVHTGTPSRRTAPASVLCEFSKFCIVVSDDTPVDIRFEANCNICTFRSVHKAMVVVVARIILLQEYILESLETKVLNEQKRIKLECVKKVVTLLTFAKNVLA